jgi:hypothetical protein
MLEITDSVGRGGVLRLRRPGQRLDGRGPSLHVFVCRDRHDAQGAPHQPQANESDHPVLLFVALGLDLICGGFLGSSQSYRNHLQITAALERRGAMQANPNIRTD